MKFTTHNRGMPISRQELSVRLDAHEAALLWALLREGDRALLDLLNDHEAHILACRLLPKLKAAGLPGVIDDFIVAAFNERQRQERNQ